MATKLNEIKTEKKEYGRVEDGTYPARIVQLIMLGSQVQTDWQTGEAKEDKEGNVIYKEEVWVTFEFPTERVQYTNDEGEEVDRPRWQSKNYVLSMNEKANFFKMLNAVNPEAETLHDLLGKAGTVTVGSTSSGKAKITGVNSPMKGMPVPELENDAVVYDLDEPDQEVFDSLPDFLQEKIKNRKQDEVEASTTDDAVRGEDPFAD